MPGDEAVWGCVFVRASRARMWMGGRCGDDGRGGDGEGFDVVMVGCTPMRWSGTPEPAVWWEQMATPTCVSALQEPKLPQEQGNYGHPRQEQPPRRPTRITSSFSPQTSHSAWTLPTYSHTLSLSLCARSFKFASAPSADYIL